MSQNMWEISPAEHQANSAQFASLNPQNGKIDGNTARGILMKSNLPPQILAQIWALSDTDRDGLLDVREFSIAMRLTRNCIAGQQLPPALPASLQQVPAGNNFPMAMQSSFGNAPMAIPSAQQSYSGMGSSPIMYGGSPMNQSMPVYNSAPASVRPSAPGAVPASAFPGKQCANWTIPHQNKLRYCQQFNQLDKQRVGWLSGQAGRSALGLSGLPTPVLAHIWNISDVNKDGKLNVDEFAIAMHLIDMHKNGFALPDVVPPELAQMCGLSRSANNSPQLEPGAPPAQKSPAPKTFEDKRMDNFAKGQAELERRRQLLMEEENRRKAELEKREREEFEKRERERLEKERRREAERQAELERQRRLEEERMEMERKRELEREQARKAAEKQRIVELEKIRLKEMQSQKQQELERTAQRQQRQKTLGFQIQALDEKSTELDNDITKTRDQIVAITKDIEGMRGQRDEKVQKITSLQTSNQQLSVQAQELAHHLLQLQSANKETTARKTELEDCQRRKEAARAHIANLKAQKEQAAERTMAQRKLLEEKENSAKTTKDRLQSIRDEYKVVLSLLSELQLQAQAKLAESDMLAAKKIQEEREVEQERRRSLVAANSIPESHSMDNTTPRTNGSSNPLPSASTTGTTKHRAIYEFVARSEDELSFQPGDVILVFEGHNAEPGWRAGQIKDKVGWFPADFAEPIAAVNPSITQPIQNMPPNVTPSPSLDRIPEEAVIKNIPAAAIVESEPNVPETVICQCIAQFPWKARNEGDLSFNKGDSIEVIKQQDMKWCGRKADGSVGWFPKSYVKVQQSSSKQTSFDQSQSQASGSAVVTPTSRQPSIVSASNSQAFAPTQSVSNHSINGNQEQWYVAMYEFEAAEETDLPLAVGDKILVLEQNDSWWKGRVNGREGIFPANYVQKLEPGAQVAATVDALPILCRVRAVADFDATAANQLTIKIGDEIAVREKSDAGWWEGETTRDGVPVAGWFPGDYAVVIEGKSSIGDVSATALFDYQAQQPDELSFNTGDVIVVDTKEGEWWTGHKIENPSTKGLFPASYVQLSLAPSLYEEPPSLYEFPPSTEELETLVSSTSQPSTSSSLPLYDFPVDTSTYQPPLYEEPPIVMEETPVVKPKVLAQRPPPLYEEPPIYMPTEKYKKLAEEMMSTEERYLEDLVLAKKLFYQNLVKIVSKVQLDLVFLNWDQLIETSKRMLVRMRRQEPMGSLFLSEINTLSVFVTFCKGQQSALEAINTIMKSPDARALYTQCCASPHARGMTLNYFLMIPLGRITRYPLLVEKMLKETDSSLPEYQNLDDALQLLRALVTEVNQAVTEMDTVALLCWAQQHIKCPNIVPAIEFTSSTREMGNRMFLHSSVIYKARSGKLLVGILFNDFLLLTTPDETIAEPDSFRISKNTDTMLTLYKQPYLLNQLRVEQGKEGENFINLFYGDETIHLRCISNNSAKLWLKQIQQALDLYAIAISESQNNARKSRFTPMGRLLVEIMKLQNVTSKNVGHAPHCIRVRLGNETKVFDVDISKPEVQLTMQFEFESMECFFSVAIYQKRTFCPDLLVLEESNVKLRELVNESSKHRGPIMKHMHLRPVHTAKTELIVTKFGIQLYESDI